MPTEGWFSCLFSILKWATNDRPYVVNGRPMIATTSLMGETNDHPYVVRSNSSLLKRVILWRIVCFFINRQCVITVAKCDEHIFHIADFLLLQFVFKPLFIIAAEF